MTLKPLCPGTSPTPWTYTRTSIHPGWQLKILDATGGVVLHRMTFRPHSARDEANIRLIVEAVNAHTETNS